MPATEDASVASGASSKVRSLTLESVIVGAASVQAMQSASQPATLLSLWRQWTGLQWRAICKQASRLREKQATESEAPTTINATSHFDPGNGRESCRSWSVAASAPLQHCCLLPAISEYASRRR